MSFQVTRNGQMYGPYTVEQLQQYVATGNVLPSDMVKGEGMSSWVPVATLVSAPPPASPGFHTPHGVSPAYGQTFPPAPNLGWGVMLLLICFFSYIFMPIWYVILASWSKKIAPRSGVPALYWASSVLFVLYIVFYVLLIAGVQDAVPVTFGFIFIIFFIVQLIVRFKMRTLMEEHYTNVEPFGLVLSGVMTFFFAEIYFQYHFNRINRLKGLR